MGRLYVDAFRRDPAAEMVAVCDLDGARAEDLRSLYGLERAHESYEEMLGAGDLDAVVVATPDFAHREPAIASLEAGCHVLCEKPLAMDTDDARAIAGAVSESGKRLMVNFGNRHRPQIRRTKALLDAGRLGDVQYLYVRLNERRTKREGLAWADRSSPLWFLGSHATDIARWLVGSEVSEVYARGYFRPGQGASPPETVSSVVTFESGTCCTVESSWNLPLSFPRDVDFRIDVLGEEGAVSLDCGETGLTTYTGTVATEVWDWPFPNFRGDETGWWHTSCYYFTDCLVNGRAPEPDEKDGLAVVEALAAMEESLEEGHSVRLGA
jgi:predicted dehydrogenase